MMKEQSDEARRLWGQVAAGIFIALLLLTTLIFDLTPR
jgi:hypothetical protein